MTYLEEGENKKNENDEEEDVWECVRKTWHKWITDNKNNIPPPLKCCSCCWRCNKLNLRLVWCPLNLPKKERQPAQEEHAHNYAQSAGCFVLGTPSFCRSHRTTWNRRGEKYVKMKLVFTVEMESEQQHQQRKNKFIKWVRSLEIGN